MLLKIEAKLVAIETCYPGQYSLINPDSIIGVDFPSLKTPAPYLITVRTTGGRDYEISSDKAKDFFS